MSTYISEVLWHSAESKFTGNDQVTIRYNKFENYTFKIIATSPRGQWVNVICVTAAEWRIYVSKIIIIGSDDGLSPDRRQAIIWTNAGMLLIGPLGTNFSEILIEIQIFQFKKMNLKMSSGKCWPFSQPQCVNTHYLSASHLLTHWGRVMHICVSELTIIGSDNGLSACRLTGAKPLSKPMLEYC